MPMVTTSPKRAASHARKASDSVPADSDAVARPINNAENIEALAYGFGIPPEPVLSDVRRLWWRLRRQAVPLPVEGRVILIKAGAP